MNTFNTQSLLWIAVHTLRKLGIWGILSIIGMTASGIFYISSIRETQQKLVALTEQSNKAHAQSMRQSVTHISDSDRQDRLIEFYGQFPSSSSIPDTLVQINRLAAEQQIPLNSGDYKLNKLTARNQTGLKTLTQYEIVLPVKGNYVKVRQFISAIMATLPSVAITDIQMRRETTLNANIDAKLVLVLYVKADQS